MIQSILECFRVCLEISRLTIFLMLPKSKAFLMRDFPFLSLNTGCLPSIPESRTAHVMPSHFTLNRVRAASPLTDGTDRPTAGDALRLSETCQIRGAS